MQQKPPPERVGAWLFHVAANLAKEDVRRSRRREHREARVASGESTNTVEFARVEQDEVRELVEALPQQLRPTDIAPIAEPSLRPRSKIDFFNSFHIPKLKKWKSGRRGSSKSPIRLFSFKDVQYDKSEQVRFDRDANNCAAIKCYLTRG
jgi:(p)ppGpp synthase/HD superfamily hydrolase